MTRGLYASAGGMIVGINRTDVLGNDLSNVNTTGFKRDRVSYGSFRRVMLDRIPGGGLDSGSVYGSPTVNASRVDLQGGSLRQTSNDLDLAVEGEGWFVVASDEGEQYTRNGHFTRRADGILATGDGYPVMGENGPIFLPEGKVTISEGGDIHVDNVIVDRLRLVRFADPDSLTKAGGTRLRGGGAVETFGSRVKQGFLENSNTDPMRLMVEMIGVMRGVEASQRVIQTQDQTLQSVLDIARR